MADVVSAALRAGDVPALFFKELWHIAVGEVVLAICTEIPVAMAIDVQIKKLLAECAAFSGECLGVGHAIGAMRGANNIGAARANLHVVEVPDAAARGDDQVMIWLVVGAAYQSCIN